MLTFSGNHELGSTVSTPYQNPRHRSESINIGELYDFMYVLEDREVIDINQQFLGNDPDLEKKIRYLGKVTNKVYGELPSRSDALDRFGLPDKKIVLISLGRNCLGLTCPSDSGGLRENRDEYCLSDRHGHGSVPGQWRRGCAV